MSRAQPKSSPTDDYARKIAQAITKGRPPPFSDAFDRYCANSPGEIFAAFTGAARHLPPAGEDEALAVGYLFLLQRLLEHLRFRTDRDDEDAAKLIVDFQAHVVAQVEAEDVDGGLLSFVGGALHQSKIPASPEFIAASSQQAVNRNEDAPLPTDVRAALVGVVEACGGDPFLAVGALTESGHAMPADARGALAGALAAEGGPEGRGAAVLFLLDPDSVVRRAVGRAQAPGAASRTPTEVRRLIAIRNWRPEEERSDVDAIIRKARAAGIDCAPWEAGSLEVIFATAIDGAMTQALLLISPSGRKKRLSSILIKNGIADAFSTEPETRRRIETSLAATGGAPMFQVSRRYIDHVVAHQLAISIEQGQTPPFGLLQVAEMIGGADWQPARTTFSATLAGLMAQIPKEMHEPAALASVLRRSHRLTGLQTVAPSWFEDAPRIREIVEQTRGRDRAKLQSFLLQGVLAQYRDKWADLILRTASWMQAATVPNDLCWRELTLVAKALADGRDMTEIGLMRDVASRTIETIRDMARERRGASDRT
jgi:hypothetical protein